MYPTVEFEPFQFPTWENPKENDIVLFSRHVFGLEFRISIEDGSDIIFADVLDHSGCTEQAWYHSDHNNVYGWPNRLYPTTSYPRTKEGYEKACKQLNDWKHILYTQAGG